MRMPLILGGLMLLAGSVEAQSIPSITKTKAAATKAVAASNAQTRANSTLPEDTTGAPKEGRVATDSAAGSTAVVPSAGAAFERETYLYDRGGRRDPFVSLMSTSELRPLLSDLQLVAVAYDATGRNSVAVLHDLSTKDKEQYRIRVGQSVGRMRVASISPKAVTFTIEEFGYSRQETLALGDSNKVRKQ